MYHYRCTRTRARGRARVHIQVLKYLIYERSLLAHEKIIRKEAKERGRKEDIKFVGSRTVSPLQCLFSFVWNVCGFDLLSFLRPLESSNISMMINNTPKLCQIWTLHSNFKSDQTSTASSKLQIRWYKCHFHSSLEIQVRQLRNSVI